MTELKEKTGLDRTVVHRLLSTREDEDLATRLESRYAIGPRTLLYGNSYVDRLALRRAALPYLVDFHIRTLGTLPWAVTLGVPAMNEVLLVERLWMGSLCPLDTLIDIGTRFRFDHSALGRCILAFRKAEEIERLVGRQRANDLAPTLRRIRARGGVEFSSSEIRPGISAVSAAVLRAGVAIGAVAISGTKLEGELSEDSDLSRALKRLVAQISRATS